MRPSVTIERELLDQARAARTASEDADRQALLARADYHAAIRRLHLAGASVRDLAQALSLSHQRVQQIVTGAGGSWWRRGWRARTTPDAICTWCSRPPSQVSKLIAGPKVYVCDACVAAAETTVADTSAVPFTGVTCRSVVARCAFCARRARKDRPIALAPVGHICGDCIRACREILDGRAA